MMYAYTIFSGVVAVSWNNPFPQYVLCFWASVCVCVCIPCHLSSDLHEWLLYCCSLHIYIYTHIYIHIHVYLYLSSFIVVIGFKNFRLTCVWLLYCCSLQAV